MSDIYEISVLSPESHRVEKIQVEASTRMDVERQKSNLVRQGYVTMQSKLISTGDHHAH